MRHHIFTSGLSGEMPAIGVMGLIDINVRAVESVVLVEVNGRIDSMNANQLGAALEQAIDEPPSLSVQIVLDLSAVDYMSSAGLREIVSSLKKAKRVQGDLRIAQPSERVREVMEMAGLDTIFQIYGSLDEAVNSF
ncbi:STAS domain-containing protein [bacterium]|nr:STAS domain-containing protein [bacterium]